MKHRPNLVQQAQAELNAQEQNAQGQNAQGQNALTPIPPTPQPVTPGANNRVRAAAEVPLPVNRNNVLAAKRKAAREEPNIWNMNQGRSLFQLGPNARPAISPAIASPAINPAIASPAINPSGYPFGVVPSFSRRNRRRHNTTPGLAKAQSRKAEKLHAEIQRRNAARKALIANNGLGNNPFSAIDSDLLEQNKLRNSRRLENNAKRAIRAKKNLDAFVSPVGLYGNNTFVENIGSKQKEMSSPPPPPRRRSYPENQGAAAAAAFAANLNAAAAPPVVPFSFAAPPAVPQFSSSVRGTNLERANAENQAPRKQFVVAPVVPAPEAPENAAREAALRAVRTSSVNNSPAVSNAVVAAQLERNSVTNQEAIAAAKERVERYKLGILPEQRALRTSAAANHAAAVAAAAAHEAAFAKSGEGPDVYGCTPCDRKILEKLDTLLDRSKPSNVLGALKGTGAFVVTQVAAALSDAVAALKLAQEKGSKKARKVAEDALKYAQKKLGQLLKALTLSDETKKKIAEALENVNKALKLLYDNRGTILLVATAPIWGPIYLVLEAARKIIEGLTIVGSATYNYLKTVVVPAATLAWSSAKTKILTALGLAASWMNNTRKALGTSLYNFGTSVGSRLSRGTRGVRNYLSGRTKKRDSILRFIKRKYLNEGVKVMPEQAKIRWVGELVETGMDPNQADAAIQAVLSGLKIPTTPSYEPTSNALALFENGKVTATNGVAQPRQILPAGVLTPEPTGPTPVNFSYKSGLQSEAEKRLAPKPASLVNPNASGLNALQLARKAALARGSQGGKRSRKNRKSSRKNRKASRKNRK